VIRYLRMKGINLLYKKADVVVVGAGIAGLTAAYLLQKKGYKVHVFEAANQVGGRIRTDKVEGFLLDRGFQLFYSAYPEVKNFIDVKKLNIGQIYNGSLIRYMGDFNLLSNPSKEFKDVFSSLVANNATLKDKMKMLKLLSDANSIREPKMDLENDITALEYLQKLEFSEKFINSFFKPFLASTFLDNELQTPSTLLKFIFKMFSKGSVGLPEKGMSAIPEQMAKKLEPETLHLQSKVKKITSSGIQLLKGDFITADRVLLATNPLALKELLPEYEIDLGSRNVSCLYFTSNIPPVSKPVIVLNGEDKGLVNNMCVVNLIQPTYAPKGSYLIAVNITKAHDLDDEELVDTVMKEMAQWYGIKVNNWQHVKTYHIKYALPKENKWVNENYAEKHNEKVYICGDHLSYGSMNAALKSGKVAADLLHQDLKAAKKAHPIHRE
jgi:phytoene dehydrogenase-like protein